MGNEKGGLIIFSSHLPINLSHQSFHLCSMYNENRGRRGNDNIITRNLRKRQERDKREREKKKDDISNFDIVSLSIANIEKGRRGEVHGS